MFLSRRIVVGVAVAATVGAGVAAAVLLARGSEGDSAADGVRTVQPGAPGEEGRELTDQEAAALELPEHTAADTTLMQNMIVHHQQALDMTALVEDRTDRDDLPLLAERITVSQTDEIGLMDDWLTDRSEEVPDPGDHQHELMPGMAAAEELDQLEEARGAAFDQLFLELMIAHHLGALTMVEDLYDAGGGLEPAADGFARDVTADQYTEILRMQDLLGTVE